MGRCAGQIYQPKALVYRLFLGHRYSCPNGARARGGQLNDFARSERMISGNFDHCRSGFGRMRREIVAFSALAEPVAHIIIQQSLFPGGLHLLHATTGCAQKAKCLLHIAAKLLCATGVGHQALFQRTANENQPIVSILTSINSECIRWRSNREKRLAWRKIGSIIQRFELRGRSSIG